MAEPMSRILFENKKAALGFAGTIIVAAMIFSGSSDPATPSSDAPESRLAQAEPESAPARNASAQDKEEIAFADDEELIDDTGGFDPSPGDQADIEEGDAAEEEGPADEEEPQSKGRIGDFDEDGFLKLDEEF